MASDTPTYVRLPRPGDRCAITGLSRSALREFCEQAKVTVAKPTGKRGAYLILRDSLMAALQASHRIAA